MNKTCNVSTASGYFTHSEHDYLAHEINWQLLALATDTLLK